MSSRSGAMSLRLESDRMIYMDVLRLASSYLIIVYHFQNQMILGQAAARWRAGLAGFTLAVDLFFFISGFVIASVYAGRITGRPALRDYLVKRLARLAPLHWATFAAFAVFGILHAMGKLPSNHPELYDARCAVPNLLLVHAFDLCHSLTFNYVSWSISSEMGMYLLFPFLVPLAARRGLGLPAVAAIVAGLSMLTAGADEAWLDWSFDGGVLRALPSFLLGMIAFHHRSALGRVPRASSLLVVAFLAFVTASYLQCPKPLLLLAAYVIGALGIAASEQPASALARRIAPLGQLTYSLYMLHPLIQTILLTGIGATALKLRGTAMNLFVLGGMAAMLPVAWLSLVMFERPARRWMTRTLGARQPREAAGLFTPDSRW